MQKSRGVRAKSVGVVVCIIRVAHQQHHHPSWCHQLCQLHQFGLQTHTIVQMATPIGRQAGVSGKKLGVAGCMARDVQGRLDAQQRPSHMTVLLGMQTGWPGGQWRRNRGAAPTKVKVALLLQGVVLEPVRPFIHAVELVSAHKRHLPAQWFLRGQGK